MIPKSPLDPATQKLSRQLGDHPNVEIAALVRSRAKGTPHEGSDWDIAIAWKAGPDWFRDLADSDAPRIQLAEALGVPTTAIDLTGLRSANLTMRAAAAEEGTIIAGVTHLRGHDSSGASGARSRNSRGSVVMRAELSRAETARSVWMQQEQSDLKYAVCAYA